MCDVYGPNAVLARAAKKMFMHYQFRNFDVKDASRFGRQVTDNIDVIFEKVPNDL